MNSKDRVEIGYVSSLHGIRGELKVRVMTDFPDRFTPGKRLYVGRESDETLTEVTVKVARTHKDRLLLLLEGVEDRNSAERFRGLSFWIDRNDVKKLPSNSYYLYELEGLKVYDMNDNYLGILEEVLLSPAHDTYLVKGERTFLIPAVKAFIKKVDINSGKIIVDMEKFEFAD